MIDATSNGCLEAESATSLFIAGANAKLGFAVRDESDDECSYASDPENHNGQGNVPASAGSARVFTLALFPIRHSIRDEKLLSRVTTARKR
jgi:hypothetical protein